MAHAYQHLSNEEKAAIDAQVAAPAQPQVTDELRRAWEADHYAHSKRLETETDPDRQQEHRDAMAAIEAALHSAGPQPASATAPRGAEAIR